MSARLPRIESVLPGAQHHGQKLIRVTQTEIDEGVSRASQSCIVAEAIKHCIPEAKAVAVDLATIRFTDKTTGDRYIYQTPGPAQQTIIQFDQGIKPEPFSFKLRTLYQIRPKSAAARRTPTIAANRPEPGTGGDSTGTNAPEVIGGKAIPRKTRKTRDTASQPVLGNIRRFGIRTLPAGLRQNPKDA